MVSLHKAVVAFLLQFLIVRHQHPLKACQCSKNVSKLARNYIKEQEINLNAHYFYRTLKTQDNIYIKDVQSFHILFPSIPLDLVLKVLREFQRKENHQYQRITILSLMVMWNIKFQEQPLVHHHMHAFLWIGEKINF